MSSNAGHKRQPADRDRLSGETTGISARYAALLDKMSGGVINMERTPDGQWKVGLISNGLRQTLGLDPNDLSSFCGENFYSHIHPEDLKRIRGLFDPTAVGASAFREVCRLRKKDGGYFWVSAAVSMVRAEDGSRSVYAVCSDVDTIKRSEMELQESQGKLMAAIEHAEMYFWEYEVQDGRLIHGYKSVRDLGVPEILENAPYSFAQAGYIHPDCVEDYLQLHLDMKKGLASSERQIKFNTGLDGGSWYRVKYTNTFDENKRPVRAYATAQNIDAYKDLEERFAVNAEQEGILTWVFDIRNRRLFQSEQMAQFFGGGAVIENVPQSIIETGSIFPNDAQAYRNLYERILAGETSVSGIVRKWTLPSGSWDWYRIHYRVILDKSRQPVKAIGSLTNINAQIEAEKNFAMFQTYRALALRNTIASFRMNLTTNWCGEGQTENLAMLEMQQSGTADGFFEYAYQHFADPEELERYRSVFSREHLLEAFARGDLSPSLECRYCAEGRPKWIRVMADMRENPRTHEIEALIYAFDIHQEKTASAIISRLADLDYEVVASIDLHSGILTMLREKAGTISFSPDENKSYAHLYAKSLRALVTRELADESIRKMSLAAITSALQSADAYVCTYPTQDKSGSEHFTRWKFFYLDMNRDTIVFTRSDVTDTCLVEAKQREILKHALAQARQASAAKSQFLSHISHEIRTPMNAIIGMTALAAQAVNDPEQVLDCLSKVGISARFLLALINDILDMSRIESGKILISQEKIPFEEFINGINTICYAQAAEKGVECETIMTSFTEDTYIGDATKLQQVILNILSNAIKFTPPGGRVQLTVHQEKIVGDRAYMNFIISDTGIGIREEFMPRLYEPFEQAYTGDTAVYGGTGLGLAICKNIVDLMGGTISVKSLVDTGTEFTVKLKLGISEETKKKEREKKHFPFGALSALVVDDEALVCRHTEKVLLDMGLRAQWVTSGADAIRLVQEKWHRGTHFDMILIDSHMPEMDGIETARQIRAIVGAKVSILIAAHNLPSIESEAKAAGADLLISKPLFRSSLCSTLEHLYESKKARGKILPEVEFDFSGKRVLLVEDHMLNAEVAKRLLTAKSMEVDVAENGLIALEHFAQKPDGYYDAILMDIRMPVMDGLTATRSLRQMAKASAKTIPIIAMSAHAFDEDMERSKAAGMSVHLVKPIQPSVLYQTLRQYFENHCDTEGEQQSTPQ